MHLRKSLTKVKASSANNFYTEEIDRKIENSNVKIGSANTYKIGDKTVSRSKFYSSVCKALGKPDFNFQQYL